MPFRPFPTIPYRPDDWSGFRRLSAMRGWYGPFRATSPMIEWLRLELSHTSCAIEDNPLSRNEVQAALARPKGRTALEDQVLNHALAFNMAIRHAGCDDAWSLKELRLLHQIVCDNEAGVRTGVWRREELFVGGRPLTYKPVEIDPAMKEFRRWLSSKAFASPGEAFAAHLHFVTIHPFDNGNGRTARLLMNAMLMQSDYPPVIIPPDEKKRYFDSIRDYTERKDDTQFMAFMAQSLVDTYRTLQKQFGTVRGLTRARYLDLKP